MHTISLDSTILLTGGTGFAGSHLVEALLAKGYRNIHVTTLKAVDSYVSHLLPADHIHAVNLTDQPAFTDLIKKIQPAVIFHLAAFSSVSGSFEKAHHVLANNTTLQLNVLEVMRQECPACRIIIVGSGMEYDLVGHPTSAPINEDHPLGPINPYAVSKVIQDLLGLSYFYSYKLDVVRVRPFNHIGERQTVEFAVPSFAQQIVAIEKNQQQEISVGNLDAIRDFTDVKDIAAAYILLMEKGESGAVYNVGSGVGHTMQEILDMLCQFSTAKIKVVQDPAKIRPLDVPSIIADSGKIKKLGWVATVPLEQTLQRILTEWRNRL